MEVLLDPSTGVFSWHAFASYAGCTINETRRRNGSLSLLIAALDISSVFMTADSMQLETALRGIAGGLLRVVRGGDMVARRGRRSFGVLAQDAQYSGATRLIERIQAGIPRQVSSMNRPVPLTVSIGGAIMPQEGQSVAALLGKAEAALAEAVAAGGNQARISGALTLPTTRLSDISSSAPVLILEQHKLVVQRRNVLTQGSAAFQRGEAEGIGIQTRPGVCPACLGVARDTYQPNRAPVLPITGCTTAGGCRCVYYMVATDPRKRPPPIPAAVYDNFEISRDLHEAATFGSDPENHCSPETLAEFLDGLPLLPCETELELAEGEVLYAVREGQCAWEYRTAAGLTIQGPSFPLDSPFRGWLRTLGRPPSIPDHRLPSRQAATIYLTNWRLIFETATAADSVLLADILGVEYLSGGFGCRVRDQNNRLVFLLRDGLQFGLCVTRALRDIAPLLH